MATTNIELDIENITGVTDANDQFIISAQKFVVSSVPKNLLHFAQKASSASTDGSAISFSVNDSITDVQRNGYSCKEISMSEAIWAFDSTSLRYATAKHPVWYHKQGAVHFAPVTDGSNAGYVFYVDYSLIDDDSDLRNAVVYHATSSEFSKLASSKTDITVASTTLSNIGAPPVYTSPNVTGDGSELTDVDDLDTDNTIDVHADQIEFDQWWSTVTHLIEGEEDVELASATLQKISTYINAYSQSMQNKLNEFNDANVEYQAKLQEAIQQAQINAQKAQQQAQIDATDAQQEASLLLQKENQEYASKLQKFSAEVAAYQADVNEEAQKVGSSTANASFYSAEGKKYYDWAQLEVSSYIKNNSKMISMAMASQSTAQQGR